MAEKLDKLSRLSVRIILAVVIFAILAPVAVILVMSVSDQVRFAFPPDGFGWRQYRELFRNPVWMRSIRLSLSLALPAAALAVGVAVPVCLVAQRSKVPGRNVLQGVAVTSIIIPMSALAVGLFALFSRLGLTSSNAGLVIAEAVVALPIVVIGIAAGLSRIPRTAEFAAMTMGASLFRSIVEITGRALLPAIVASAVMGFLHAFDEVVIVNFVGGPGQVTLPKAILDSVQYSIDPVITAAASLLMLGSALLMVVAAVAGRLVMKRREG
ncbi:ABC transporter permease subunit [Amycolatopsis sp. K13G38]|uniref:ABC transporter permease subunit n=1 Tax=Amycolatopsis acididurans TaxID=2724524 RepID=A0ABX1JDJ5_9PSEU|nr:ABC transporter permease subunit [Amycolatopsis acididurans]NKQ57813.1 ABC transporter permease subunit [Amycolatopsis acididurans]